VVSIFHLEWSSIHLGELRGLIHWIYLVSIQSKLNPKVVLPLRGTVDLLEEVHKPPLIQVLSLNYLGHGNGTRIERIG